MAEDDRRSRRRPEGVGLLVAEKLRLLRLIRALDRAAIDPTDRPALQVPLVRVAEIDAMLAALVEVLDRDPDEDALGRDAIPSLLRIAEEIRGDVTDALDAEDREAFRRASGEVAASEAEIWMEVESLRQRPATAPGPHVPMSDEEAARTGARTWARTKERPLEGAAKVKAQERRMLPKDDAPLAVWFERMPEPWRVGVARIHDLSVDDAASLPSRLAARLADGAWLRRFLADRLGASERDRLAWLVEAGGIPLAVMRRSLGSGLEVHWDWSTGLPASSGGKLRAAGFVHVGMRGGRKTAVVPPAIRGVLRDALRAVDPNASLAPERSLRQAAASALDGEAFPEARLDHWKRLDKALSARFENWVVEDERSRARKAFDVLFAGLPRVLRSEAEQTGIFEFVLFDWRSAPGEPTLAETRLRDEKFASEDERLLAEATAAALPRIYRVGRLRRGQDLELVPVFPEGPPVLVSDRRLSMTAESDWLLGARVYRAGPYVFLRLLGDPVAPERSARLLRALQRELDSATKAGVASDSESLVRARPHVLLRTLRAYRG